MANREIYHKFVVKELSFVNRELNDQSFKLKPLFSKKITKLNDNEYEVALKVEIKNTVENPFPFDLVAIVALVTKFVGEVSKEELDEYLNKTSVSIIFPYLRSSVTSLTSAGLMTPLVLPVIDVRNFEANQE